MYKSTFFYVIILFFLMNIGIACGENLVKNGDFEGGISDWTEWSKLPGDPGSWTTEVFEHDYAHGSLTWPPSPYPFDGERTHCQKVGGNNVHGGLYQTINVIKGKEYVVSGEWYGGIGGIALQWDTTIAWFEISIYDGAANAAQIDAALGSNDANIAKITYGAPTGSTGYSFGWESFSGVFTAKSDQVTLALKTGKVGSYTAIAAYHDNISMIEQKQFWPMFLPATTGLAAPPDND